MTVAEAVRVNAASERPLSPMELAVRLGCHVRTVHQAQSRARARGEVPVSARQITGAIPGPRIDADVAELADVLRDAGPLLVAEALEVIARERMRAE